MKLTRNQVYFSNVSLLTTRTHCIECPSGLAEKDRSRFHPAVVYTVTKHGSLGFSLIEAES